MTSAASSASPKTSFNPTALMRWLFGAHLFALIFGLVGLIVIMPHPDLLTRFGLSPQDVSASIAGGQRYTGSLHILLGAVAVLAFGLLYVGRRKTLIFFAIATLLPLGMELLGTGTGWPFGAYSYTANLGYKVLGRVPFTIPLSWFYMGFTSYLLASVILATRAVRHRTLWSLLLGAWFLTAWDLVLDPAMASNNLPFKFWIWHVSNGIYFGMPLQNFAGWSFTGLLFMALSRFFWRADVRPGQLPTWFPFAMYAVNMGFAFALSLSVSLWPPIVFAALFGLLPASLALRQAPNSRHSRPDAPCAATTQPPAATPPHPLLEHIAQTTIHTFCRVTSRRALRLEVEGVEHIPATGPVLIAARHYHHLYDGCALITAIPRPIHILVALDWVRNPWSRRMMEWACHTARWPVVLRGDPGNQPQTSGQSAFHPAEAKRLLRHAVSDAVRLLREGSVLVVFPEAYPNVDPAYTPKAGAGDFLPFRAGVTRLAELAGRDGTTHVQIVPAGLAYQQSGQRMRCVLRLGAPLTLAATPDITTLLRVIEEQVRTLSTSEPEQHATSPQPHRSQQALQAARAVRVAHRPMHTAHQAGRRQSSS